MVGTSFLCLKLNLQMKTKLVETKAIAQEYKKPISTIQRWVRLGIIPSIQIGHRTWLFDPEAVRKALLEKTVPATRGKAFRI
jgi:hypothetical protein